MESDIQEYDDLTRIYPDTIYLYDPDSNPTGASLPGIPLRHLRLADVATLPDHIIRSIEASGFYALVPIIPPVKE